MTRRRCWECGLVTEETYCPRCGIRLATRTAAEVIEGPRARLASRAAYARAYYQENRERLLAYTQEPSRKARAAERQRQRRLEDPEKARAIGRRWKFRNRERVNAKARGRYGERQRSQKRAWLMAHPEKRQAYHAKVRAKRGTPVTRVCKSCGASYPHTSKAGHPRLRCDACWVPKRKAKVT